MLAVALAGFSALAWGTSDFCGGLAVRGRVSALRVTVVSHLWGTPLAVILLIVLPGRYVPQALLCGAAAGIIGLISITLLYRALGDGPMAIAAPVSATIAALVPIGGGLLLGERPSAITVGGSLVAVVAITLLGWERPTEQSTTSLRHLGCAVAAGVSCGLFYLVLGQADPAAGMWPVAVEAVVSSGLGLVVLACRPRRVSRAGLSVTAFVALAGLLDVAATAGYLMAAHHGPVSVVAPVAAMDAAGTVLLAMVLIRERLAIAQYAGLGLAVAALALTAA